MYITPVNFSHPATGRNKTQNSFNLSISQSNYNLNSYGIQKNADTLRLKKHYQNSDFQKKFKKGLHNFLTTERIF